MLFDRTHKAAAPAAPPDLEVQARRHRDRMAGLWAAELLGLIGHAAHDYAHGLTHAHETAPADDAAPGDDPVLGRLVRDLRGKVSAHEIREKLAHLLAEARRQLRIDGKRP